MSRSFSAFVRGSAVYSLQGSGHSNLYQLFLERALQLVRPGGRVGFILPSGFGVDHSCAPLRRTVLDRTTIDTFTTIENRGGIFPVHRGLKFLLLTLTASGTTGELPVRSGVRAPESLDGVPDVGTATGPAIISVPRRVIERIGGDGLAVPEIRTVLDLDIVSAVSFTVPASADRGGWDIRFGRELNATDDRHHFTGPGAGLQIVEGKQVRAFGVDLGRSRHAIPPDIAARLLDPDRTFRRPRLGYREIAAATNRTTLIAAIIPPGVVTTHTVFCMKNTLDDDSQHFLCGILNSYVANYLVRMRVSTHVTAAIIARLPVPKPPGTARLFRQVATLSRTLSCQWDDEAYARVNALAAIAYGLSRDQFARVLETFPLVPARERSAALLMYDAEKV